MKRENTRARNSSSNPGKAGWNLSFYVTGEGLIPAPAVTGKVNQQQHRGSAAWSAGRPDRQPAVTVTYFAEANGLVSGMMQVNAIVPAGVHTGQAVPLSLSMNGNNSQSGVVIYTK